MTYPQHPDASGSDPEGHHGLSPDAARPDPERERLLREEARTLQRLRPPDVDGAFALWMVAIVVSAADIVLGLLGVGADALSSSPAVSVVAFLIRTAVWLFFVLQMRAGQNWARIVLTALYAMLTVLALVAVSVLPAGVLPSSGGVSGVIAGAIVVLSIAAVVLMFRSRTSDYFERR